MNVIIKNVDASVLNEVEKVKSFLTTFHGAFVNAQVTFEDDVKKVETFVVAEEHKVTEEVHSAWAAIKKHLGLGESAAPAAVAATVIATVPPAVTVVDTPAPVVTVPVDANATPAPTV